MNTCKDCAYFTKDIVSVRSNGMCRWLPKIVMKSPESWCGQYNDNDEIAYVKRKFEHDMSSRY